MYGANSLVIPTNTTRSRHIKATELVVTSFEPYLGARNDAIDIRAWLSKEPVDNRPGVALLMEEKMRRVYQHPVYPMERYRVEDFVK